jgi:hypothetical protein
MIKVQSSYEEEREKKKKKRKKEKKSFLLKQKRCLQICFILSCSILKEKLLKFSSIVIIHQHKEV